MIKPQGKPRRNTVLGVGGQIPGQPPNGLCYGYEYEMISDVVVDNYDVIKT